MGLWLTLYMILSASAVALVFLVAIWQRNLLESQKHELEEHGKALAIAQNSSSGTTSPLTFLNAVPLPACVVTQQGIIASQNTHFRKLTEQASQTLQEFNKATGGGISVPAPQKRTSHVLKTASSSGLRHFHTVTWPISGTGSRTQYAVLFLEYTAGIQRARSQQQFVKEAIQLGQEVLGNSTTLQGAARDAALEEVSRVLTYLEASQTTQPLEQESLDIAAVIKRVIEDYRPVFRKRSLTLTTSLPRQSFIIGDIAASRHIIDTVMAAVAEHAQARTTVRLDLLRQPKHTVCVIRIIEPKATSRGDLFAFGSSQLNRESKARLALARFLMHELHGSLHVKEDGDGGITVELSFAPAHQ